MNEELQEQAWRDGWRPTDYTPPSTDELAFAAEHPGWVQASWAHPDWSSWVAKRHAGRN